MQLFAADPRDGMLNSHAAIFYPSNFDPASNLPSFALVREFPVVETVSQEWEMLPHFFKKEGKTYATFAIPAKASLYGTGEVTGTLLRNGKTITMWNAENVGYKSYNGDRIYKSHPWVMGVNPDGTAFGIIGDFTWRGQVALTDSIRFISEGPEFRVIVIKGKSPQELMEKFSDLVGRMEMPPLWAIGYHQCRYSYYPESMVKQIADTFREKKLPCDAIWMDIDYMDAYKIFTFSPTNFPDPKGLNDYLHAKNFKAVWMINTGIKSEPGYPVYDSGLKDNHWVLTKAGVPFKGTVWPGTCVFADYTRPETQQWWSDLYKDFLPKGMDGIWNDMNEPSVFDGPDGTMPIDNLHRGGGDLPAGPHLRYHNVYGMLMTKASREGIKSVFPEKRPFILSRAGYLGSHRYAANWSGDPETTSEYMKLSIPMALTLSLSGQSFTGPDIGGHYGLFGKSLFAQWFTLGAFYPFSRNHSYKESANKEPWAFGVDIEKVTRTTLYRRYRMLPFLYTLFYECSTKGLPIMRPVFFADPTDASLRREEEAFLMGSDMLVIPKWAKTVAMPKGAWTSISLVGEDSRNDEYQPDIRLRAGAILPLGQVIMNTTEYNHDSLTLVVALDSTGKANGWLYDDAGEGLGYKNGEYCISTFNALKEDTSVTISIQKKEGKLSYPNRNYRIEIVSNNTVFTSNWSTDTIVKMTIDPSMTVKMLTPVNNVRIKPPVEIAMSASASIDGRSIDSVQFYCNDTLLVGKSTSAPYQVTWKNALTGLHRITAKAFSGKYSMISEPVAVWAGTFGTGKINRDTWTGITGLTVNLLTSSPKFPDNPDIKAFSANFEAPTNFGDDFGTRMYGYLCPPVSGYYKFWISSDDNSQLWLSSDKNPENKKRIAYISGESWTTPRDLYKYSSQESQYIFLEGGKEHYMEALQKEGPYGDNLSVSWKMPGVEIDVIKGEFLSPYTMPNSLNVQKDRRCIIYPNPASHYITIESPINIKQVKLMNMHGNTQLLINNPDRQVDISKLKTGLYIVEVLNENNEVFVEKIEKTTM